MKHVSAFPEALAFDDVLIQPAFSSILPSETSLQSCFSAQQHLSIPFLSAAMDTVTESKMAIAMAQQGGLGIIHRNLPAEMQANEVHRVKKFEAGMVVDPITLPAHTPLRDALTLMKAHTISGIPIVEPLRGALVGILTHRDVRFATNMDQAVRDLMTKDNLVTASQGISQEEAKRLLHQNRIEKLLVVDAHYRCVGLITVKDLEKQEQYPLASKDTQGRLLVGAATTTGKDGWGRSEKLLEAGCDVLVVDTAHGHSERVLETVRFLRTLTSRALIVAGNIATKEAALTLIDAGVDVLKVGIGPGSICTTRIVTGVGIPQLTAIRNVAEAVAQAGVNVGIIADGGIRYSGDVAKALAAGATSVMLGSALAGSDEAPGDVFLWNGRSYKVYRGMGSASAMSSGSADRYAQAQTTDIKKFVPEGVEGQVPYKGPVASILHQMTGGLRAALGYVGACTLPEFRQRATFVRITSAGYHESHVHGVMVTRETPNYTRET